MIYSHYLDLSLNKDFILSLIYLIWVLSGIIKTPRQHVFYSEVILFRISFDATDLQLLPTMVAIAYERHQLLVSTQCAYKLEMARVAIGGNFFQIIETTNNSEEFYSQI